MGQGLHQLGPLPGSAAAQPELRTPTIYFRYRQKAWGCTEIPGYLAPYAGSRYGNTPAENGQGI